MGKSLMKREEKVEEKRSSSLGRTRDMLREEFEFLKEIVRERCQARCHFCNLSCISRWLREAYKD